MLSAQTLKEITTAYGAREEIDPSHKMRRALRMPHTGTTMIFRVGGGASGAAVPVQMRDISARGCSFTCKVKLERDSNFILQFAREGTGSVGFLCTVKHCRTNGDLFRIGAEFTCILADKKAPGPSDAREAQRISASIFD